MLSTWSSVMLLRVSKVAKKNIKQAGAELSQAQQQLGSCTILLFYAVVMYGDEAVSKKCFEVYSQPLTT